MLSLVNGADEAATVAVTSQDKSFRLEVTVPANGSTTVRLAPGQVYELGPDSHGIRAGLSLSGGNALAGFPIWPADAAARPLVVYP